MGRQDEFRFMTDTLLDECRGEWSDSGVAPSAVGTPDRDAPARGRRLTGETE